jgi:alkanesulfonate monooxygenase SsuD/methylene tetrahydromethanopterin reductase-like flavin-dependent oxidoreductase (luciferase family)
VKFGIFYEHQLPRPWHDGSEQQLINDALDQIELADKVGIQYLWEVEHHFLEEYSHSSAPEVFLAAASQRTKRMRIGHGIIQTAPAYNHPARTAERVAMLDLVSNGRVEFGSGESSSEAELGGFKIDPGIKREAWLEGLEVAIRCMTETPFGGVEGRFVQMPPRNVIPKPVQRPHPPLWVACSRRDTILLAAEKGIGALSFAFIEPEDAKKWVDDYERVLREQCVPVGLAVNPQVACVSPMMCAPDEDDAIARGLEGANFFGYSLAHFYVFGDHVPASTNVWEEFRERRDKMGYSPEASLATRLGTLGAKVATGDSTGLRGATGTPAQLREFLRRYEEAGVDQLIFVMQAGKNRHEHIMESIELFGTQVLPEFVERDDAASSAKTAKWAPVIEAALARRVRHDPTMPSDYVMRAIPKQMVDAMQSEPAQQWLEALADKQAAGVQDEEFRRLVDGS